LADAEKDGMLTLAGSVYSAVDDRVRDGLAIPGPRLVTFHNLLKHKALPFAEAVSHVLELCRRGMGNEVEIELALDAGADRQARLYLLQLRPMTSLELRGPSADLASHDAERVMCRSDRALGHGSSEMRDIVYVAADRLTVSESRLLVSRVRELCQRLAAEHRPFLLIGHGRWGSADPLLGIGVAWSDIQGSRAIVELPLADRHVEPSQGTHFFRNITAARVGYITVENRPDSFVDRAWLDAAWRQHGGHADEAVRHIELAAPIAIQLDGRRGSAAIVKPAS
jgi:hypothetical protein